MSDKRQVRMKLYWDMPKKWCEVCGNSGFRWMSPNDMSDEKSMCPDCDGLGYTKDQKPPLPEGLKEHMVKAWNEYWRTRDAKQHKGDVEHCDEIS